MLSLTLSALSFSSVAGAMNEASCKAHLEQKGHMVFGEMDDICEMNGCAGGGSGGDLDGAAQVMGMGCYFPWPPTSWPMTPVCPSGAGLIATDEGDKCPTLNDVTGGGPGTSPTWLNKEVKIQTGPKAEEAPNVNLAQANGAKYWIDKGFQPCEKACPTTGDELFSTSCLTEDELKACRAKPWGYTSKEWASMGFMCDVPGPHGMSDGFEDGSKSTKDDDFCAGNKPNIDGDDDENTDNTCNDGGVGSASFDCQVVNPAGFCVGYGQDCFSCGPRPIPTKPWMPKAR